MLRHLKQNKPYIFSLICFYMNHIKGAKNVKIATNYINSLYDYEVNSDAFYYNNTADNLDETIKSFISQQKQQQQEHQQQHHQQSTQINNSITSRHQYIFSTYVLPFESLLTHKMFIRKCWTLTRLEQSIIIIASNTDDDDTSSDESNHHHDNSANFIESVLHNKYNSFSGLTIKNIQKYNLYDLLYLDSNNCTDSYASLFQCGSEYHDMFYHDYNVKPNKTYLEDLKRRFKSNRQSNKKYAAYLNKILSNDNNMISSGMNTKVPYVYLRNTNERIFSNGNFQNVLLTVTNHITDATIHCVGIPYDIHDNDLIYTNNVQTKYRLSTRYPYIRECDAADPTALDYEKDLINNCSYYSHTTSATVVNNNNSCCFYKNIINYQKQIYNRYLVYSVHHYMHQQFGIHVFDTYNLVFYKTCGCKIYVDFYYDDESEYEYEDDTPENHVNRIAYGFTNNTADSRYNNYFYREWCSTYHRDKESKKQQKHKNEYFS